MTGQFVVFEGGEGSGKSTQARRLAEARGALLTREPGGTPLGAEIRKLLLDPGTDAVSPRAEALLMAADRAHHVATKIRPALEAGTDVISDRYLASSIAYQGDGRELGAAEVASLSMFAVDGLLPDLVILLDVPTATGRARAGDRGAPDKMEQEDERFHRRVHESFRRIAAAHPERWIVIDGTMTEDEVAGEVRAAVADRLGWTV